MSVFFLKGGAWVHGRPVKSLNFKGKASSIIIPWGNVGLKNAIASRDPIAEEIRTTS